MAGKSKKLPGSKWLKGTTPEQPISQVASRALADRFTMVFHYAPLAAKKPHKNVEYVHQLRVATRRARAVLDVFGDLLPRERARRMKRRLRELRTAAGNARDLDVFAAALARTAKRTKSKALGKVVAKVRKRRQKAQRPLLQAYQRTRRCSLKKSAGALVARTRWRRDGVEPMFRDAARHALASLLDDFFTAAESDLSGTDAIHQLRIHSKRVRYAMELLAGAFGASFRDDLYPVFEDFQERLGTINDHATAQRLLSQWMQEPKPAVRHELAALTAHESDQLVAACNEFRAWWTPERVAELRARFKSVLAAKPCSSKAHGGVHVQHLAAEECSAR